MGLLSGLSSGKTRRMQKIPGALAGLEKKPKRPGFSGSRQLRKRLPNEVYHIHGLPGLPLT
jgi:hypothetical protein